MFIFTALVALSQSPKGHLRSSNRRWGIFFGLFWSIEISVHLTPKAPEGRQIITTQTPKNGFAAYFSNMLLDQKCAKISRAQNRCCHLKRFPFDPTYVAVSLID